MPITIKEFHEFGPFTVHFENDLSKREAAYSRVSVNAYFLGVIVLGSFDYCDFEEFKTKVKNTLMAAAHKWQQQLETWDQHSGGQLV